MKQLPSEGDDRPVSLDDDLSAAIVMPELAPFEAPQSTVRVAMPAPVDIGLYMSMASASAGEEFHAVDNAPASGVGAARAFDAASAAGFAMGEPTGDFLGRPDVIGDPIVIGDIKGDGFGEVIWIDDTLIGTGWYDGDATGEDDGGSYDYSSSGQWTMAVGDFNGDGLEDTLVATYAWDAAGTYSTTSTLVLGGGEGSVKLTDGGRDVSGRAVSAAGDVNGDGCDDLLVTTYDYSDGTASTYLVFGAPAASDSQLDLATLDGANAFKVAGSGEGKYSYVGAVGDVNGDGFADVSVSVYDYASGSYAEYVVYGAADISEVRLQLAAISGDYPLGST